MVAVAVVVAVVDVVQNFSTCRYLWKRVMKSSKKNCPPYLKSVAALPCLLALIFKINTAFHLGRHLELRSYSSPSVVHLEIVAEGLRYPFIYNNLLQQTSS